jgi:hypothetical protein
MCPKAGSFVQKIAATRRERDRIRDRGALEDLQKRCMGAIGWPSRSYRR